MRVGRPVHEADLRPPCETQGLGLFRLDQTKTPDSFPPEVLLEVSRQTIGIRSCAERECSEPPCSGP